LKGLSREFLSGKVDKCEAMLRFNRNISSLPTLDGEVNTVTSARRVMEKTVEAMEGRYTPTIEIPFSKMNEDFNGGFKRQDLVCFTGLTGVGKTVFLMNIARHIALKGMKVLYITTEMSEEKTIRRWMLKESMVENVNVNNRDLEKPSKAMIGHIQNLADNVANYNIDLLIRETDFEKMVFHMYKKEYDVIITDHIHDVRGVSESISNLENMVDTLNTVGKDQNSLMLIAAQYNKEGSNLQERDFKGGEDFEEVDPINSDIKGSGIFMQKCSQIFHIKKRRGSKNNGLTTYCDLYCSKDRDNNQEGKKWGIRWFKNRCAVEEL
jgi:predicted ATP-dependent serine protease